MLNKFLSTLIHKSWKYSSFNLNQPLKFAKMKLILAKEDADSNWIEKVKKN